MARLNALPTRRWRAEYQNIVDGEWWSYGPRFMELRTALHQLVIAKQSNRIEQLSYGPNYSRSYRLARVSADGKVLRTWPM